MIRFILLLLFTVTGLFADYKKALYYYNHQQYTQAMQEAKHSKKSYANPNLHLIWAYSAQKLGLSNEAMQAFERVLILDTNNKQAKKALQSIYRRTGRTELLDKNERDYVYTIRERGAPERLVRKSGITVKTKIAIASGYDSNVNASPGRDVLNNYFDTQNSEEQFSSFFSRLSGSIRYKYNFGDDKGWYAKSALRLYAQSNFSAHLYDLSMASLEVGAGYAQKAYDLYFPLHYYRINYLDRDLLEQYRFMPAILIPLNNQITLDISLLYSQNNYFASLDQDKDDRSWGFSAGSYYLFGQQYAYFGLKYENRKARHSDPSKYITAQFLSANTMVNYYFNPSVLGTLDYTFKYGGYHDHVGLSTTKRDDNLHQLNLKLSYLFSKKSQIYLSDTYYRNISNYTPSEYTKNSLMLGLSYTY